MTDENNLYGYAPPVAEHVATPMTGNAAPDGMDLANQYGVMNQAHANGYTTVNAQDNQAVIEHATNVAKQMQAEGKSEQEILDAVGKLSGVNMDNVRAATDAAKQVTGAEKFNLMSGVAKEGKDASLTLGSVLAGPKYVLDDHERGTLMSTTATIAALGEFSPEAGLPGRQRQQGLQRG